MNNKLAMIFGAVLLLLLLSGFFITMNKKTSVPNQKVQSPGTVGQSNSGNKMEVMEASLKSLLTAGKTVKCTFTNSVRGVNVNGTVYTSNGKIRQDFSSNTPSGAMNGHMIIDSSNGYMWTDQTKQGYKIPINEQTAVPSGSTQTQASDVNKKIQFSCLPWTADSSLFTLPTDITFQSMIIPSIPAIKPGTNNINTQDKCAVCNNVPEGAAKESCKAQLQCK
jgi:hypothetical protein